MTDSIERVDRGHRQVVRRARVAADAHDVFALLANPHRHHEIDGSGTVKPQVIGPRELRAGDKFRVSMQMHRIPYSLTSTATEIVPDRVVEWQHPGKHRWRWSSSRRTTARHWSPRSSTIGPHRSPASSSA